MADYYTTYLTAKTEADRENSAVWFAPTEAAADVVTAFFNDEFGATAYGTFLISDADFTGAGTLADIDGFAGWKYQASGNERFDAANRALIEGLFGDSSSSASSGVTSSASGVESTSTFSSGSPPPPP